MRGRADTGWGLVPTASFGEDKKMCVPKTGEGKKKQVPKDTAGRFCLLKAQKEAKVGNVMFSLAVTKKSKRASRWLSGKESACQCKRHGLHP